MPGCHGRYLSIDAATGEAEVHAIPETVPRRLIGGTGLATYLLYHWCPPGTEPLAPENPLIFASSPFTGTGITTASKLIVATRSPQTGMIGDSLSSSYLALALKRTGFDALVITGRAAAPSVLIVEDESVSLHPADDMLGLDPGQTTAAVRARFGTQYRVAAIGRAGERGVRYASITNDGRMAGRTGTGAVMGSKQLKAIAVHGTRRLPPVADPPGLADAARALAARSLGTETAKYRELGTAANLAFFSRMGILPTRNFASGRFEESDRISGEALFLDHRVDKHACAACTVGCEHHYRVPGRGGERQVRLEYESLFALGSLCGVGDPDAVLRAAALCDDLGLDAISAGATVAWAMECAERGVGLGVPKDELPRFGDAGSLLRTIAAIGERSGLGDLLAEGSRRAAEITGQGSDAWAMHVKGLELPGYHPSKLPTLALGMAVAARGACHNRSSAYDVDLSDQLDTSALALTRARAAAESEDRAALLDSLTICKFLRHCFDDLHAEAANLATLVTGVPTTAEDLRHATERITNLKKLFNINHGWRRADDTLPARLLDADGSVVRADQLDELIAAYYAVRHWNPDGTISERHLQEIGLSDLLDRSA